MNARPTRLPGVLVFEPPRYDDARGSFTELWNRRAYAEAGLPAAFAQDNLSRSRRGVVRGLHYQHPQPQAKLVCVLEGSVYDVVVDVRRGAPTFGQWIGVTLSAANGRQLFVPEGFAHGFAATSEQATFFYKCSVFYAPGCEHTVRWDDPDLGIDWPVDAPLLSDKDAAAPRLRAIADEDLPRASASSEEA